MPTIKPLRDVDSHDILNSFKFNVTSQSQVAQKGTFVKITSGVMFDQNLLMLGSPGAAYPNTVSNRYGVQPSVDACTSSGDATIGFLLYDVRELDENGEKLIFHPDKQAQMQVALSGQPVPILTRGLVYYSGISGNPSVGQSAYLANDGGLSISGSAATVAAGTVTRVGRFLGPKDSNGFAYLKLEL